MDTTHRISELRRFMEERGIRLSLITNPDDQYYLSGFKAIIYSRPIDLLITPTQTVLIVPALEEAHARSEAAVDDVLVYYEHPEQASKGKSHLDHLGAFLKKLPAGAKIGVQSAVISHRFAEYLRSQGLELVDVGDKVKRMRFIKDASEISLMEEAGRLVCLALRESLAAIRPGITEIELDASGNQALFKEVASKHPDSTVEFFVMSPSGPVRSVMPHVFSNTRAIQQGDIVIHSRQVALNGYRAECERTCFVGKPTPEQERAFKVMVEAQQAAIDALRPGVAMKEVDWAARSVIQKAGFGDYAIHRTGHGLGLSTHEEPYLRFDEEMVVEESMVFSIEPGFYVSGLGGFRHSDTVVVTSTGCRLITHYPRDLQHLVF